MKKFLVIVCCAYSILLSAQESFTTGILPKINGTYKLNNTYKLNFSVESRHTYYDNLEEDEFSHTHNLIDITTGISYKTSTETSLNLSYTLRLKEGRAIHRAIQRYNIVNQYDNFKLGHRIGLDQTFEKEESTAYRIRYRAVALKPFNGDKVDIGEWYGKLGNEYLYQNKGDTNDLEIRVLPSLGYQFKKSKLEFGLDYRLSQFVTNDVTTKHRLWTAIAWYFSI